jgi:hypothetical protein
MSPTAMEFIKCTIYFHFSLYQCTASQTLHFSYLVFLVSFSLSANFIDSDSSCFDLSCKKYLSLKINGHLVKDDVVASGELDPKLRLKKLGHLKKKKRQFCFSKL